MRTCLIALAAITAFPALALADDFEFPARKAGQWEITMTATKPASMPAMVLQMCIDESTDKAMMSAGLAMTKDKCEKMDMAQDGDDYVIDSVCQLGPIKSTSHVVVSGDFDAEYTVSISGTTEGGPMPGDVEMTQTAKWVGDCSDLKPGEMLMPGGMKIDATKMMGAMGGG